MRVDRLFKLNDVFSEPLTYAIEACLRGNAFQLLRANHIKCERSELYAIVSFMERGPDG